MKMKPQTMRSIRCRLLLAGIFLLLGFPAGAAVTLPQFFSHGMVLQRDAPVSIWGSAGNGEKVSVGFSGKRYETIADKKGFWEVALPPEKAGGPYVITVNDLIIQDVLFGDVWLCSGQSNMETPVSRVMDLYGEEVRGYENPHIRYIKIGKAEHFKEPQRDVGRCSWKPLLQTEVMDFSAICYFYAKRMYESTGVPVGIVNASVGGSGIEQWMSPQALEPFPLVRNALEIIGSDEYARAAESYDRIRQKTWQETLNQNDRGLEESWEAPDLDTGGWTEVDMFADEWKRDDRYQPVNGSVWFRRTFRADGFDTTKDATIRLGTIIDADYAYVNGVLVGSTSYQYPPRVYKIPAGVLNEGENVVAVRIVSYNGRPSFVEDKPYEVVQGDRKVSLGGRWKYRRGTIMPPLPAAAYRGGNPTGYYHAMLAPLLGYGFKGVIWYQGESNAGRSWTYAQMLTRMIESWRAGFEQPSLPFFIVQLPLYGRQKSEPSESGWAEIREAQAQVAATVPSTTAIVTIDTGEWNDIHPKDKKTIGDRIALAARRVVYGEKIVCQGPVFESSAVDGNRIIITFAKEGGKLKPADRLYGFSVAADDEKFVWADAWTEKNHVVVSSDRIPTPKYVRYAWADNPGGLNLCNTDGMPAMPFRTK